jgi:hypothetical protein
MVMLNIIVRNVAVTVCACRCWFCPLLFQWVSEWSIIQICHGVNKIYSIKWSQFRANQSLFLLLDAACLAEKKKIPILVFGLTWQSTTLKMNILTITPRMRFLSISDRISVSHVFQSKYFSLSLNQSIHPQH